MTPKERKELTGILTQMVELNAEAKEITGDCIEGRQNAIRLAVINTAVRDIGVLLSGD